MTLGDFMDVLVRLHKLTPAQRRAVAEVLAEPEAAAESQSEAVAKPGKLTRHFQPYSDRDLAIVSDCALRYSRSTTRQRQKIYREAADTLGRSAESVKKMIRIARKELESKREAAH